MMALRSDSSRAAASMTGAEDVGVVFGVELVVGAQGCKRWIGR
jgi:hypothetical protein